MDRMPCFELGGGGSIPSGPATINTNMKLFEATIRTQDGREFKDRVGAETAQEARLLLQQRYGPRAVPYIPKLIPSWLAVVQRIEQHTPKVQISVRFWAARPFGSHR